MRQDEADAEERGQHGLRALRRAPVHHDVQHGERQQQEETSDQPPRANFEITAHRRHPARHTGRVVVPLLAQAPENFRRDGTPPEIVVERLFDPVGREVVADRAHTQPDQAQRIVSQRHARELPGDGLDVVLAIAQLANEAPWRPHVPHARSGVGNGMLEFSREVARQAHAFEVLGANQRQDQPQLHEPGAGHVAGRRLEDGGHPCAIADVRDHHGAHGKCDMRQQRSARRWPRQHTVHHRQSDRNDEDDRKVIQAERRREQAHGGDDREPRRTTGRQVRRGGQIEEHEPQQPERLGEHHALVKQLRGLDRKQAGRTGGKHLRDLQVAPQRKVEHQCDADPGKRLPRQNRQEPIERADQRADQERVSEGAVVGQPPVVHRTVEIGCGVSEVEPDRRIEPQKKSLDRNQGEAEHEERPRADEPQRYRAHRDKHREQSSNVFEKRPLCFFSVTSVTSVTSVSRWPVRVSARSSRC